MGKVMSHSYVLHVVWLGDRGRTEVGPFPTQTAASLWLEQHDGELRAASGPMVMYHPDQFAPTSASTG